MAWCSNCQGYKFSDGHVCPPTFLCEEIGCDRDPIEVHAHYASDAAEKFCELLDGYGDYDIIRAGEAQIKVTDPRTKEVTVWDIVAESVPNYSAYAAKGETA